jgi:signal transduction histidine kinase
MITRVMKNRNRSVLPFRSKRILYRIIFPFTLLFGITTLITWLLSAYFITRYLDDSLKSQMTQIAGVISRSKYILSPTILAQLKVVINAEIVLADQNGQIIRNTFAEVPGPEKLAGILKDYSRKPFAAKDIDLGGTAYRTTVHPLALPGYGSGFLSLWMPVHQMRHLKTRIILGVGGIAFLGILAMAGLGFLIARTITAPVEDLVKVTGRVSEGDLSEKVTVIGIDEIGSLASSFNRMIDRLKDYEQKLVESEKLATAGQMAAGLAHEIRNPLTSIKMLGQVLISRLKDRREDQKMLDSMVREIDRLDRIIQQMINRTRPGELERDWHDLNPHLDEVICLARESLSENKITLKQHLAGQLPKVYLDAEKFKQVIWNLILNAKEAMPKGGKLVVSSEHASNHNIRVSVEDTGHGIPSGNVEQLFQPFFTTKPEGVGLGLTMSRKIVEKHGGRLILENLPGNGTRAVIELPVEESRK